MKYLLAASVIAASFGFVNSKSLTVSPLSTYSREFDKPEYTACNTAVSASYMTSEEKNVIYILNMARMNPKLFCTAVVKKYTGTRDSYVKSLIQTMNRMKPQGLIYPDSICYISAQCHAAISGSTGYAGHDRSGDCLDKRHFNGECCDYGHDKAIDIVMALLIDENVESLGHRSICFSPYKVMAVSIAPHTAWRYNAVLDFHF
ncbi:MAG: hypothetical protein ABJA78_15430 [Ferruginibacter sp.]